MNKKKKLFGSIFVCCCIMLLAVTVLFSNNESLYAKTITEVEKVTMEINKNINEMASSKNPKSYSSSPYVIVEGDEAYEKLVNLGVVAIKPLYDKIANSSENGLMEYIYAMAIEEIMQQNYSYASSLSIVMEKPEYDYGWASAKEFEQAFSKFMKKIPSEYNSIMNDTSLTDIEKNAKVRELGLGVVPYIISDIQNNKKSNFDYENMLVTILSERNQIEKVNSLSMSTKFDVNSWISANSESYELLKKLSE